MMRCHEKTSVHLGPRWDSDEFINEYFSRRVHNEECV